MAKKNILVLILIILTGCQEAILHNLTETEANQLMTRLHEVQIPSKKFREPDGKWGLQVPRAKNLEAIKYLSDTRVLRHRSEQLRAGGSLVSSRDEQRFLFERSLSREIESTLAAVDGVLEARVHLNMPAVDPLFGRPLSNKARGSASVLLVFQEESSLDEEQVSSLVAGAAGIEPELITVVLTPYRRVAPIIPSALLEEPATTIDQERSVEQISSPNMQGLSLPSFNTLGSEPVGLLLCLAGLFLLPILLYWRNLNRRSLVRIVKEENIKE